MSDLGPWFTPVQAAPLIGVGARAVRELCQDQEIEHRRTTGPAGVVRYKISQQAIERYNRRTVTTRGAA